MFKKTMQSVGFDIINPSIENNIFTVGKKFSMHNASYRVVEIFESDNTPMIRIVNTKDNSQQIIALSSLLNENNQGNIKWG